MAGVSKSKMAAMHMLAVKHVTYHRLSITCVVAVEKSTVAIEMKARYDRLVVREYDRKAEGYRMCIVMIGLISS